MEIRALSVDFPPFAPTSMSRLMSMILWVTKMPSSHTYVSYFHDKRGIEGLPARLNVVSCLSTVPKSLCLGTGSKYLLSLIFMELRTCLSFTAGKFTDSPSAAILWQ